MKMTSKRFAAALCALTLAVGMTGCGKTENEAPAANDAAETTAQTTAAESKADEAEDKTDAEAKTEEKTDDKTEEKTEDVKNGDLNIGAAADNVAAKLDEVKKAANGELNEGYTMNMTYTPSGDVTAEVPGLKTVSVIVDAKQKDKLTGINYAVEFDSKPVVSLQMVADSSNETGYVVVPELSDGVLTASADDIEALVNKNMQAPMAAVQGVDGQSVQTPQYDMEALKNIDYEALADDLASYVDTVKENFPEPTDGGEYTVSADGVSIPLTVKTYTITGDDKKKLADAVIGKLKADEQLKGLFTACGMGDKYEDIWTVEDIDKETTAFDVYYNGETPAGIATKGDDGKVDKYAIYAATDKNIVVDCDFSTDNTTATCKGGLTYVDNTINGAIKVQSKNEYSETNGTVEYKNLYASEDTVRGDMIMTVDQDGAEVAKISVNMDVNGDGGKVTEKMSAEGREVGTFDIAMQKTDASDIKIPDGKVYNVSKDEEMQAYLESCDVEGFKEKVRAAVGDELFNQLFPQTTADSAADTEKTATGKA